MAQIFANNVAGTLAANIGPSDTLILLGAGQGALFPVPAGGQWYYATLVHVTTGVIEIVQVTGRTADTLTVVRGRDSTSAMAFTSGSLVEMRLTAQGLREVDWNYARGVANGVAPLDAGVRVPAGYLPANVAYLDGGSKIPFANLPDSLITDGELSTALGAYLPTAGGTVSGSLDVVGNLRVDTVGAGTSSLFVGNDAYFRDVNVAHTLAVCSVANGGIGLLQFGNGSAGIARVGYDGTNLQYNGNTIWHAGNFNPAAYLPLSGGTISGSLVVATDLNVVGNSRFQRFGAPTHGLAYFGSGSDFIVMDGANWSFGGGKNVYANDFISTSDRTKKEDINYYPEFIGIADKLRVASFKWKENNDRGRGPIAQDVREYAPQHVYEREGVLHLDKGGLALDLIADLAARVRTLEHNHA